MVALVPLRIRHALLALALGTLTTLAARAEASAEGGGSAFADCRPERAWVVAANGAQPVLRSERLPAPAAQRLAAIGRDYLAQVSPEGLRGHDCSALYGQIYRWMVPGNRQLFGIRLLNLTKWGEYQYFVFDPNTGAVSPSTVRLNLTDWLDENPKRRTSAPEVSVADLYRNGQKQIVIAEQKRNGNMYSVLIHHYFDLGKDLALTRMMALENEALQPVYGPGESVPAYKRRLTILGGNRLRIDTALGSFEPHVKATALGFAILASDGPGTPFRVVSRHPRHPEDDSALVETSWHMFSEKVDDDRFLQNGCPDC